jgi:hypothetical protein
MLVHTGQRRGTRRCTLKKHKTQGARTKTGNTLSHPKHYDPLVFMAVQKTQSANSQNEAHPHKDFISDPHKNFTRDPHKYFIRDPHKYSNAISCYSFSLRNTFCCTGFHASVLTDHI